MRFKGWYIGSKNDHSYILPRRVPAGFEHRDEPWMPILDPEGQEMVGFLLQRNWDKHIPKEIK